MNLRLPAFTLLGLLALAGCDFGSGGGTEGVGLSGTLLLPDGSPAVGEKVLAFSSNDLGSWLARGAAPAVAPAPLDSTTTDARGRFRLTRLHPGTYNLAPPAQAGDSALGWFRKGVAYAGGTVHLGNDTLRVGGGVTLQVLEGDHVRPGATCFVPGSPYRATTDEQGSCFLHGLPPGKYRLAVSYAGYKVSQIPEETFVESGLNSICGAVNLTTSGESASPKW